MVYNNELKVQYEIMTEEQKNEFGYTPNYEALIEEAPNEEIAQKWIECKELFEKCKNDCPRLSAFAFNSVYIMKMKCGHYEIFQHSCRSEKELVEWIALMQTPKHYKKCTRCICEFR